MRHLVWLVVGVTALCACNTRPITMPGEGTDSNERLLFDQTLNNRADILFMIDTSASMAPMQASLRQYFPNFMQPLKDLPTMPDLHIGIVTSDVGAGAFTPPSCATIGGDQGMLQNTPKGDTCATAHLRNASDRFLIYQPDGAGGVVTNFTGDVADAFACYAAVGDQGCGFEHQLASVHRALDGCATAQGCKQTVNANFLRPEAYLAVVYLTNEDDCSAPASSQIFDPTQTSLSSTLGPMTSYRCFEFGNLCGGVDPGRQQGPRASCEPGNKDLSNPLHQLTPVEDFVAGLKALKPNPSMVYVSAIAAPPGPVNVGLDTQGYPDLQPSCTGPMGGAEPAIRMAKFLAGFDANRSSFTSICSQDLRAAMEKIASELARILGQQCLSTPLKDKDPAADGLQPDCVVEDRVTLDAAAKTYDYRVVPACQELICDPATAPGGRCKAARHAEASPDTPCWFIWPDQDACPMLAGDAPQTVRAGYQILIDRGIDAAGTNPQPPPGTAAVVQCSSCVADPSQNSYDCSPGCAGYWPGCCRDPQPGCFQ